MHGRDPAEQQKPVAEAARPAVAFNSPSRTRAATRDTVHTAVASAAAATATPSTSIPQSPAAASRRTAAAPAAAPAASAAPAAPASRAAPSSSSGTSNNARTSGSGCRLALCCGGAYVALVGADVEGAATWALAHADLVPKHFVTSRCGVCGCRTCFYDCMMCYTLPWGHGVMARCRAQCTRCAKPGHPHPQPIRRPLRTRTRTRSRTRTFCCFFQHTRTRTRSRTCRVRRDGRAHHITLITPPEMCELREAYGMTPREVYDMVLGEMAATAGSDGDSSSPAAPAAPAAPATKHADTGDHVGSAGSAAGPAAGAWVPLGLGRARCGESGDEAVFLAVAWPAGRAVREALGLNRAREQHFHITLGFDRSVRACVQCVRCGA